MNQAYHPAHHLNQVRITDVSSTPVAFKDPPLLNTVGVHEPFALRAVIEVHTDSGVSGLGETYGDAGHIARLGLAARALPGADVFNINELRSRIAISLQQDTIPGGHGMSGMVTGSSTTDRSFPRSMSPLSTSRESSWAARSVTCSAALSGTPCSSAGICSTSGPATLASRMTPGAPPWTRQGSLAGSGDGGPVRLQGAQA